MGSPASAHRLGRRDDVAGRWAPLLIVVGLIALVVGGAQVLSTAAGAEVGTTLAVGTVQIQPRPGWDVEAVSSSPPAAVLHRGPVVLDVTQLAVEPAGPLLLAERYLDERLRPALTQLAVGSPETLALPNGVPAVRVPYVGVTPEGLAVDGIVTAATGSRSSAVFDASAPTGELVAVGEDVQVMVDHAVVP
jgi:hypothetical protein